MEIKKADSKGRVSGFEQGTYYQVVQERDGRTILIPVKEGFAEWMTSTGS